jgi:hypothetical protein
MQADMVPTLVKRSLLIITVLVGLGIIGSLANANPRASPNAGERAGAGVGADVGERAGARSGASQSADEPCNKPVYLTLDTGNMASAEVMASMLRKHQVKASFFWQMSEPLLAIFRSTMNGQIIGVRESARDMPLATTALIMFTFPCHRDLVANHLGADEGKAAIRCFGLAKPSIGRRSNSAAELDRVAIRFEQLTGAKLGSWWRCRGAERRATCLMLPSVADIGMFIGQVPAFWVMNCQVIVFQMPNL